MKNSKLKADLKSTLGFIFQNLMFLKYTNLSKPTGVISILKMLSEKNAELLGEFPKEIIIRNQHILIIQSVMCIFLLF